jgi:16S rRNA (guanine966-N2)-methyltransferase
VREALFSALEANVGLDGARVLDLYAGSGALGFEALSRGAVLATLVESDAKAVAVLKGNAATIGLPGVDIRPGRVAQILATPPGAAYDIVFADPPYAIEGTELAAMLHALVDNGWTAPDSTVIVERAARAGAPDWPTPLSADRSRRYGDTELFWAIHLS